MTLLGINDAGDCYYGTGFFKSTLYVAGFDGQTGKLSTRPKPITGRNFNLGGSWSPDGEYLAYTSQVGVLPNLEMKVVIRSIKTGEERQMTPKELLKDYLGYWWEPQWFPDSRSLFLGTLDGKLHRMDIRTFEVRPLLGGQSVLPYRTGAKRAAALAPDGRTIYYWERDPKGQETHILRRDLDGSAEKEVCRLYGDIDGQRRFRPMAVACCSRVAYAATVSGDGGKKRSFAIMTVGVSGGEPKEVYKTSEARNRRDSQLERGRALGAFQPATRRRL